MGVIPQVKWKINLEPGICRMVVKVQVEQPTGMGRVNSRKESCAHTLLKLSLGEMVRVETDVGVGAGLTSTPLQ